MKCQALSEFTRSHRTRDCVVLESASVSYGKATAYLPTLDLLKRYLKIDDRDDARAIREKVTGKILTLDPTLEETIQAVLALLEALPADHPFLALDPPKRRQRTLDSLKRLFLRESQVEPLVLVFEDLHWIDAETQALLDGLIESLPTSRLLLAVNYRPEFQHGWGGKSYTSSSSRSFILRLLATRPRPSVTRPRRSGRARAAAGSGTPRRAAH